MDVTTRTQDGVAIVILTGNLDTNTAPQAQQALDQIVDGGGHKIVVDFTSLDYISSAGLRVLLATAKRLGGVGGTLRMFGLNETVEEVFEISGFSTIFNVYDSEGSALAGL